MFAAFFKTSPVETKSLAMVQSEIALLDRMDKMLRNKVRIAWTPPRQELPSRTGVKKPTSYHGAIERAH